MRIAIIGPSGSGKTTLAAELARELGIPHVEIDALSPRAELGVVRSRGAARSASPRRREGDGWVTDSTYHTMLGDLVSERADVLVWLDLPVPLVMWRLLRRTYVRNRDKVELWNGNVEPRLARVAAPPDLAGVQARLREPPGSFRRGTRTSNVFGSA